MAEAMGELETLLVERSITRVLLEYARAVDRRDYEGVAACYWPDAHDRHADFSGDAVAYVAWLREVLPPIAVSTHRFTNVLIDVVSTDLATSESWCCNTLVFRDAAGDEQHTTSHLRYLDRIERRGGAWRIADREVVTDWFRVENPRSTRRITPGDVGDGATPDVAEAATEDPRGSERS
jgi:hypothetical protein